MTPALTGHPSPAGTIVGMAPISWRDRRVLITGATGFKGAWLTELLLARGARVVGAGLPADTEPALSELLRLDERIDLHLGDLRDAATATAWLEAAQPEVVFHLAAQALVRRGYADPIGTWSTNVLGTVHLLEAARATPSVRAVVVVTTDKVYAGDDGTPHREDDPLGGRGPYSTSKVAAELATAEARRRWADRGLATARAGNTLGGGDFAPDRLVCDCVRAVQAGTTLELRNPAAVRPWLHVLDTLDGYVRIAEALLGGDTSAAWNIGPVPGAEPTVEEVARVVLDRLGAPGALVVGPGGGPPERGLLRLDASKADAELGWRPRLSTDAALAWTGDWYARWIAGEDPLSLCAEQIAAWEALS